MCEPGAGVSKGRKKKYEQEGVGEDTKPTKWRIVRSQGGSCQRA